MNLRTYLWQEDFKPRSRKEAYTEIKALLSSKQNERFELLGKKRDNAHWMELIKKEVLKFYQFLALNGIHEIYLSTPINDRGTIDALVTIPNLCKEGKRIYDAGCGSGLFPCWLGIKYPQKEIIGVDFSRNMIQRAKERKDKYNLSNVQFCTGDFTNTGFLDGYFDIVTCIDSILETDPDYSLNEFSRILAQGGKVIVKFKQPFPLNLSISEKEWIMENYRELFINSGFSIIDCIYTPIMTNFDHGIKQEIGYMTWQAVKEREPKPISISYRTRLLEEWEKAGLAVNKSF